MPCGSKKFIDKIGRSVFARRDFSGCHAPLFIGIVEAQTLWDREISALHAVVNRHNDISSRISP